MDQEEPYILDLSDMPLFFEDISEESYIPALGPKRIDGLSQPPNTTSDIKSKRRKNLPWLGLILFLVLLAGGGSTLALRGNRRVVMRPAVVSRTASQPAGTTLPTATTNQSLAYITVVPALSVHSSPVFTSDNVIGAISNTEAVIVTQQIDQYWVRVDFHGTPGYMSRFYLVASPDQVSGPVVATTPPATTDTQTASDTQANPPAGSGDATVAPSDSGQTATPSGSGQAGSGSSTDQTTTSPDTSTGSGNPSNTSTNQTTTDPGNTTNPSP